MLYLGTKMVAKLSLAGKGVPKLELGNEINPWLLTDPQDLLDCVRHTLMDAVTHVRRCCPTG
jgi:hypothetical protein